MSTRFRGTSVALVVLAISTSPGQAQVRSPGANRNVRSALTNPKPVVAGQGETIFISLGDSLTHGTMDGTNNSLNTLHAYAQLVADSLSQAVNLRFVQPLLDNNQNRIGPFIVPTNLGVDGADIFSVDGLEYYKTVDAPESVESKSYLCDARFPRRFDTKYDKVLYPLNLQARQSVSQLDAAVQLIKSSLNAKLSNRAIVTLWLGNNDTSTAALGTGGENPMFIPVPVDAVESELSRELRLLLRAAERLGIVSFDSYAQATIERNMTDLSDFTAQFNHVVDVLTSTAQFQSGDVELFLLSLPYYSSIGYLIDSEDLEYYLRKLAPNYSVPPTFKRVAPEVEAITNPSAGDRVSLLTFGLMYTLLGTSHSTDEVNRVLEVDGVQQDGMVLAEAEQQFISARIDSFNAVIRTAATSRGAHVHFIDVGQFLNDGLAGNLIVTVGGKTMGRKWARGSSFSLDGVHPGYTAQALIANYVLADINKALKLTAPMQDLEAVFLIDPYIDRDGDGFVTGPHSPASGLGRLLFMLTDADDENPTTGNVLPDDAWEQISAAVLQEVLGFEPIRREAEHLGISANFVNSKD